MLGVACITAGVWTVLSTGPEAVAAFWVPYPEGDLVWESGRPVLIDFYADWCLPCEELDTRTFSDPTVRDVAGRFLMIKADLTRYGSPGTERLKKRYNIRGVPTVIFIDADGQERKDLRVVGFIGADQMLDRMNKTVQGRGPQAAR